MLFFIQASAELASIQQEWVKLIPPDMSPPCWPVSCTPYPLQGCGIASHPGLVVLLAAVSLGLVEACTTCRRNLMLLL